MDKEFKFDQVGRRMPYNVPEGAFDSITRNVLDATVGKPKARSRRGRRMLYGSFVAAAMAAAASVAVMLVCGQPFAKPSSDWNDVDEAFEQRSPGDQAYLIEAYQEDVFLDEQN